MKKNMTFVLVAMLTIAICMPQTLAATSQGLFYRMNDGDRFYFIMNLESEDTVIPTEIFYVEIENASKTIPDPLTDLGDLSFVDVGINFENGTSLGITTIYFIFMAQPIFPVGNWDLIDTRAETDLEDLFLLTVSDLIITYTGDYWGYSYYVYDTDIEAHITVHHSLFDGLFSLYNLDIWNATTSEILTHFTVERMSSHNFDWGFNDSDEFNFHLTMTGNTAGFQELDENLYIEVNEDGLPVIPFAMTEWDDIPYIQGTLHWANGTTTYEPFFNRAWRVAVPIGNWSLLSDFINYKISPADLTLDSQDPWFWGYSWSETTGDVLIEVHTDYLMVDGFVARHSVVFTNTTSSTIIGTISIERLNIGQYADRIAPTIDHPGDIQFVVGTTGQQITWTPTDEYPTTFQILVDGDVNHTGAWTSNTSIIFPLDGFEVGVYNVTIIVYDFAGNYVRDSVLVTVTASAGIVDLLLDNLLYVGIAVGAVVLIGAIVFVRRR